MINLNRCREKKGRELVVRRFVIYFDENIHTQQHLLVSVQQYRHRVNLCSLSTLGTKTILPRMFEHRYRTYKSTVENTKEKFAAYHRKSN